ncbi:MAG: hypothetical protein R3B72_44005 [Polyangiaceae bacterium]
MARRHLALALYCGLAGLALVWPGYAIFGNGLTPTVLGVPWSFAWNIGWVLLTFLVLVGFHFAGGEEG